MEVEGNHLDKENAKDPDTGGDARGGRVSALMGEGVRKERI